MLTDEQIAHKADYITHEVLRNLTSRSGLDGAWDSIDEDIKEEIVADIKDIVRDILKG